MNLRRKYEDAIRDFGFESDVVQNRTIAALDKIASDLVTTTPPKAWSFRVTQRYLGKIFQNYFAVPVVKGAYLWGGVGRGKTFMMDLFFDALPFDDKLRYHFHRLMYHVHGDLKKLKNRKDPIEIVAEDIAVKARVICFDEFSVTDIADAMILGKLLNGLFRRGVSLVATSNIPPDQLYCNGLQRQHFLPAIDLVKKHTQVINVSGDCDYRLRVLEKAEIYHSPLDDIADRNLDDYFTRIAPDTGTSGQAMEVLGRHILTRKRADGIAWFGFNELCDGPRSQDDYIEIARSFQTVILSDVPRLDGQKENQARRFIALVDEFYDRKVNLIISAAESLEDIYQGTRLRREFARTRSRLREMQTTAYLSAAHLT